MSSLRMRNRAGAHVCCAAFALCGSPADLGSAAGTPPQVPPRKCVWLPALIVMLRAQSTREQCHDAVYFELAPMPEEYPSSCPIYGSTAKLYQMVTKCDREAH